MTKVFCFLLSLLGHRFSKKIDSTRRCRRHDRGVTLLELMVTIVIIGLVAGIVTVAVIPQITSARIDTTKSSITNIQQALKLYYARHGTYPTTAQGLGILVSEKLLEQVPKDAWGNDFVYLQEEGKSTIISYGSDGNPGGDGDAADINSNSMNQAS